MHRQSSQLGRSLKEARQRAGLSREQSAVAVGRSLYSVAAYELDKVDPPLSVLHDLAAVYGVPVAALFPDNAPAA